MAVLRGDLPLLCPGADPPPFTVEDWEKALAEVSAKYDSNSVRKRDEQLGDYVKKHSSRLGFATNGTVNRRLFSQDVLARVTAAEANLEQTGEL